MATTYIHRIYQLALIPNNTTHIVKVFQVLKNTTLGKKTKVSQAHKLES
jgi:hypothetical protein